MSTRLAQPGFFKRPSYCAVRLGLSACVCLGSLTSGGGGVSADSIRLRRSVEVKDEVLLKDIAVLQGTEISKHGDRVIATFESNQKTLTLSMQAIRQQLQKTNMPMGRISFQGHRSCTVTQQTTQAPRAQIEAQVPEAQATNASLSAPSALPIETPVFQATQAGYTLKDVVIDAIAQGLNARPEELRIQAENHGPESFAAAVLNQAVSDPRGYQIVWPGHKRPGKTMIKIERLHAERVVESQPIHITIQQRVMAVSPKIKTLLAGTRINTRDLTTTPVWIDHDPRELLTQAKEAAGQRLTAAAPQGQAIRIDQLPKPVLIRRGDIVDVRTYVGNLEVSVRARATKDGRQGEKIGFASTTRSRNKQTFSATVTSPGIAIVTAPASGSTRRDQGHINAESR